jgi:hypothetical protein
MADERDPDNPLDQMMPPADNPEYHRRRAEHQENIEKDAHAAISSNPAYGAVGERLTSLRQSAPKASEPLPRSPEPQPSVASPAPSQTHTGLGVDPSQAAVSHDAVQPRLPEGAMPQAAPSPAALPDPNAANVNPILLKLREDFGIDNIPLEEVEIGRTKFTMRVLDAGSATQALRFADLLSMPGSERENAINLQIALISFAVVAIDGEPVWQVFDVPIPDVHMVTVEGALRPVFAPMSPPHDIRVLGATGFMDFLSGQASPSLLTELWKQYGEKIDPKGSLDQLILSLQEGELEPDVPLG